jgi:hypothetical protein
VDDAMPPVLQLLQETDPAFREISHQADGRHATAFVSRSGFRVEFVTPNTSSDGRQGRPAPDLLIYEPVRAVLLHGAGVAVLVPAPERYAVHKLIVAARRRQDGDSLAKSSKDRRQAASLTEALVELGRSADLADAFSQAWSRGPAWCDAITASVALLPQADRTRLREGLEAGARQLRIAPEAVGLPELG